MVKRQYKVGMRRQQADGHTYTLKGIYPTERKAETVQKRCKDHWDHAQVSAYIINGKEKYLVWVHGRKQQ